MDILILRLSSMGDIALLAPVFEAIKSAHPEARISLLVKPVYRGIAACSPYVDEIISYEDFWSSWAYLKRKRWDAVLDLHGVIKTRLLSLFLPASRKAVYDKRTFARRLLVAFKKKTDGFPHAVERYMEAASRLFPELSEARGKSLDGWRFALTPDEAAESRVDSLIFTIGKEEFLIGMAPGARWETKRWSPSRYAQLAARLASLNPSARIVLVGVEQDKAAVARICHESGLSPSIIFNWCGRVETELLPRLISRFKLFVSNDSGPMHLACGLGVPTVGIFGPTVKEFGFFPLGSRSRAVETPGLGCRPCSLHGTRACPKGHFLCMELITPAEVMEACRGVLGDGKKGRKQLVS